MKCFGKLSGVDQALKKPFQKVLTEFLHKEQLPQKDPLIFTGRSICNQFKCLNCQNFRIILIKLIKLNFLETSFQPLKTGKKKSYFHSHLLRSNAPFKVLKMYVLWQCFFEKPKNVETLNILLVKNRDKDFSNVKTLITKDHSSLNCGPQKLLFRFTNY